jgi:predicted DNA-binding transcriptional regulator YafY
MLTAYWRDPMRRADRLFQILQILRRSRQPTTAAGLAAELEVSTRTVYRDIADLIAQRTPIEGEAGVGYVLARDFDMPPLMLTGDELEAAALGAQWVAAQGDAPLARAARDLLAKIEAVTPERLRAFVAEPSVAPAPPLPQAADGLDLARAREWIRKGCKIRLRYGDATNEISQRLVWPVLVGYAEATRMLVAWCELREDFRHFRVDRILAAEFCDERYPERPATLRARWKAHREARRAERLSR